MKIRLHGFLLLALGGTIGGLHALVFYHWRKSSRTGSWMDSGKVLGALAKTEFHNSVRNAAACPVSKSCCCSKRHLKSAVFWDVELCSSCVNRRFERTFCLHLRCRNFLEGGSRVSLQLPAHAASSRTDFANPKMEAIPSSETSVHTTRRHVLEDGILHNHPCENL
jgi:hypothetical protein